MIEFTTLTAGTIIRFPNNPDFETCKITEIKGNYSKIISLTNHSSSITKKAILKKENYHKWITNGALKVIFIPNHVAIKLHDIYDPFSRFCDNLIKQPISNEI